MQLFLPSFFQHQKMAIAESTRTVRDNQLELELINKKENSVIHHYQGQLLCNILALRHAGQKPTAITQLCTQGILRKIHCIPPASVRCRTASLIFPDGQTTYFEISFQSIHLVMEPASLYSKNIHQLCPYSYIQPSYKPPALRIQKCIFTSALPGFTYLLPAGTRVVLESPPPSLSGPAGHQDQEVGAAMALMHPQP